MCNNRYSFLFWFNKVSVQKEEIYEGYDVELVRIMPFYTRGNVS